MRGHFSEKGIWCFSGNYLVKGHVIFCWSNHLRGHLIFGKSVSVNQQAVVNALALVYFADFCWTSLIVVFTDNTLALVCLAFFSDVFL